MRILVVLIALLAMLPGCRKPAVAAEPIASATFVEWRMEKGPRRWTRDGLTTTLASRTVEGVERPVWTISTPGKTSARIMFDDSVANDGVRLGIGRLAPGEPASIVIQTYAGGPHCCWRVMVATPAGDHFRFTFVGEWDGEPMDWPRDRNGDGVADFLTIDDAFVELFGSYAGSVPPPKLLNIRSGQVVDVSTYPGFARIFRADIAKLPDCSREGGQDDCAAYAADAARLGRFDELWPGLLHFFSRKECFGDDCYFDANESQFPCSLIRYSYCRKTYTDTLKAFLREKGYVSLAQGRSHGATGAS